MTSSGPGAAAVVGALCEANVLFVVVGEPAAGIPLRLVVSSHPTNLDALGRALDHLGSSVRAPEAGAGKMGMRGDEPRRIGDPMGTISVATSAGDVDLLFGGPRRSLYTEVALLAEERELEGVRVQWAEALPNLERSPKVTSRMLSRRLLSIAEGLANLIERRDGHARGRGAGDDEGSDREDRS